MVDETNVSTEPNANSAHTKDSIKKTRKPRRTKAEIAASTIAATAPGGKPGKKSRAKRGSKAVAVKQPRAVGRKTNLNSTVAATVTSIDDIADLVKLEEENIILRKQLSDKLRAENADLRKRLGKS